MRAGCRGRIWTYEITASKTVALPLGDSTITNRPYESLARLTACGSTGQTNLNELNIIPNTRCIAPGQTQAYKTVSVGEHPRPFAQNEICFEQNRPSLFIAVYLCRVLISQPVGFKSSFYIGTKLSKSCRFCRRGTSHVKSRNDWIRTNDTCALQDVRPLHHACGGVSS